MRHGRVCGCRSRRRERSSSLKPRLAGTGRPSLSVTIRLGASAARLQSMMRREASGQNSGASSFADRAARPQARRDPRRCAFAAHPRQTQTTGRLQGCDLRRDRRGSRTVLYLQKFSATTRLRPEVPHLPRPIRTREWKSCSKMAWRDIVITPPTDLTRVSIDVPKG